MNLLILMEAQVNGVLDVDIKSDVDEFYFLIALRQN